MNDDQFGEVLRARLGAIQKEHGISYTDRSVTFSGEEGEKTVPAIPKILNHKDSLSVHTHLPEETGRIHKLVAWSREEKDPIFPNAPIGSGYSIRPQMDDKDLRESGSGFPQVRSPWIHGGAQTVNALSAYNQYREKVALAPVSKETLDVNRGLLQRGQSARSSMRPGEIPVVNGLSLGESRMGAFHTGTGKYRSEEGDQEDVIERFHRTLE